MPVGFDIWQLNLTLAHLTGRAGSPLPAAVANQRLLVHHDGAHGLTRPTCPNVAKNCYSLRMGERAYGEFLDQREIPPFYGMIDSIQIAGIATFDSTPEVLNGLSNLMNVKEAWLSTILDRAFKGEL
jgi:hypothetical protein